MRRIEALGFDTVWLSDIPLGAALDPVVGLSFAAAATSSLKLGANVVPLGRNPLTLAKSLAQIDQLSGGRLLLSFVVGIDQPGERQALAWRRVPTGASGRGGHAAAARLVGRRLGHLRERALPLRQRALAGASRSSPWRCGSAGAGRRPWPAPAGWRMAGWDRPCHRPRRGGPPAHREAAAEAGRLIDPEHFGLSVPYAPTEPDQRSIELLRSRRPDADVADLLPVGPGQLRALLNGYIDAGLSKFVVRPVGPDHDRKAALTDLADILPAPADLSRVRWPSLLRVVCRRALTS